jgi:hypothetical protein
MKVSRTDLKWFLQNIRRKAERDELDETQFTDEFLANELAHYMEVNPGCINMDESNRSGRYYYSTVGYGVVSLLGERYRMGRVEIFDKQNDSGYQIDEGTYCMPFEAANQFEQFIENIETDLPINIEIGTHKACQQAVAEELGIPEDKLNDIETKKAYYRKKNDEEAQRLGFKDFDDQLEKSGLGDLRVKKDLEENK